MLQVISFGFVLILPTVNIEGEWDQNFLVYRT